MPRPSLSLLLIATLLFIAAPALAAAPPQGLVDAASVVPGLVLDMRYAGPHNFVGRPVNGYQAPRCLLTPQAAQALAAVQAELKPLGLGIKVYDCYRPQRAVDHFVAWAKDLEDRLTQAEFYPTVPKDQLFKQGYIAQKSSHSRGSTVDLTVVPLPTPTQAAYRPGQKLSPCFAPAAQRFGDNGLDMGTGFDCFHALSHTANPAIDPQQRANRLLLKSLMERHGFVNFDLEWWHYTLKDEPFPQTYFDFPVR
ncbi:MAG: M15 family metallopeptidase [Desulfarculaceae bacterium]|nr:M15 family metallopeptidase [Desulfarculaceae bacterium]